MNKIIAILVLIVLIAGGYYYFKNKNDVVETVNDGTEVTENKKPISSGTYSFSTTTSSVIWEGRKTLIVGYTDTGIISIKSGALTLGETSSGSIVFDMNSISAQKTGRGDGETMLTKHLKSDDFFSAEKFPTSEFKIKSVKQDASKTPLTYKLMGDLTIKGITKPIEVSAEIYDLDGTVHMKGVAYLDRTLWDVRYGSDKFFDNLANNVIDDNFTVRFDLVTEKAI